MACIQKVDNLIALIKTFDKYENFMEELKQLQIDTQLNMHDLSYNIDKIVRKGKPVGKRKIREFYLRNKETIDEIKKYTNIIEFLNDDLYYYFDRCESNLKNFYDYISKYKDSLDKIEKILEKAKALNVEDLKLDKNLDLKNEEYSIRYNNYNSKKRVYSTELTCLANIELVPNYENDVVKYKTTDSPYKLDVRSSSLKNNKLTVDSLVFDADILPQAPVDIEEYARKIINQKENNKENYEAFRDIVQIDLYTNEIVNYTRYIENIIDKIENAKNKKELNNILKQLKQKIELLNKSSVNYYNSKIDNDSFLDKNIQEKELELEYRRRTSDY